MLKNYLTIALRNLARHKIYTTINALSLAMGIAFCLLTFLFVRHEWSYDQFHKEKNQILRVMVSGNLMGSSSSEGSIHVRLSRKVGEFLKADLPQLKHVIRIRNEKAATLSRENRSFEDLPLFVDADFFQMFSFPLIQGDPTKVLAEPNGVVLTRTTAQKYFGRADPIGQEISIAHSVWKDQDKIFVVRGVAQDPPKNSSIRFDVALPLSVIPVRNELGKRMTMKMSVNGDKPGQMVITNATTEPPPALARGQAITYVCLASGVKLEDLSVALQAFVDAHRGSSKQDIDLYLQPISKVHFDQRVSNGLSAPSNPAYSYILAGIAFAVLFIACINFINLSVARSAARAREVGVRKIVGALRFQLMQQFWGESLLLTSVALLLGIALTELFLPAFNQLTQVPLTPDYLSILPIALFGLLLLLFIGLGAGIYPAFILSGFDPIAVLKNRLHIGGKSWSGRVLVIGQFTVAILFLIATVIMSQQLAFLREKSLGLNESQVVLIKTSELKSVKDPQQRKLGQQKLLQIFKREIKRHTHVIGVTQSNLFSKLSVDSDNKKSGFTLPSGY